MKFHQLPRSPFVPGAVFYADYGGVGHFSEWASICPLARKTVKNNDFVLTLRLVLNKEEWCQDKMSYILEVFMKCTFSWHFSI